MLALILLAILAVVLFGLGFTVHILWWLAIVLAVIWVIGFFVRPHSGRRWYYW
jgi:hypothetical protein